MSTHPIYKMLSARLEMIEQGIDGPSQWFYGDRAPTSESVIRAWAADNADRVTFEERAYGFNLEHRKTFDLVVTWYREYRTTSTEVAS